MDVSPTSYVKMSVTFSTFETPQSITASRGPFVGGTATFGAVLLLFLNAVRTSAKVSLLRLERVLKYRFAYKTKTFLSIVKKKTVNE